MDYLSLLCGEHHRALHDGAFTIAAPGKQRFRFHGPHGAARARAPKTRGDLGKLTQAYAAVTATIEPDWDGSPLVSPHTTDVLLTNGRSGRPGAPMRRQRV